MSKRVFSFLFSCTLLFVVGIFNAAAEVEVYLEGPVLIEGGTDITDSSNPACNYHKQGVRENLVEFKGDNKVVTGMPLNPGGIEYIKWCMNRNQNQRESR